MIKEALFVVEGEGTVFLRQEDTIINHKESWCGIIENKVQ